MSDDLVLVTGGAGFIGSNVVRSLAEAGRRVVVSDRMRAGAKWRNLVRPRLHDLITPDAVPEWLARYGDALSLVVHMGAVSATTEADVDRITRENIRTTLDLWDWCGMQQVPFLYASSAATYGDGSAGFRDDQTEAALAQLRPLNAYGWSKHLVDRRIAADAAAAAATGRPVPPRWAGLKFFNVYGPNEDHKGDMRSLVNKMLPVARAGAAVRLFRSDRADYVDGGQVRDFIYVDDVVSVIAWLAEGHAPSGLYNLGTGQARSWNDLAQAVFAAVGQKPRIEYVDMPEHIRPHYQYLTEASMEKLRTAGWNRAFTSIEDGVRRYVAAEPPS